MVYDFAVASDGGETTDVTSSYDGTDIKGSSGGELIAAVYGEAQARQMKEYYKNMNLLNDGAVFI